MLILIIALLVIIVLLSKIKLLYAIATFAFPNARFNALGNIYVNYSELEQLAALGSFRNAVDALASKHYPVKNMEKMTDIERTVMLSELRSFRDAYETVPGSLRPVVKCYLLKWEIRYLKSIFAEKILKKSPAFRFGDGMPEIYLSAEIIITLKEAPTATDIFNILKKTRYSSKLKDLADGQAEIRYADIEQALDQVFYQELNDLKSELPSSIAKPTRDFINLTNDIANVKILLRSKHIGLDPEGTKRLLHGPGRQLSAWRLTELAETHSVPELIQVLEGTPYHEILGKRLKSYSEHRDISDLEAVIDTYYLNTIKNLSIESSLTVGPALRFIISREYETRNLTALLRGMHLKEPNENIMKLTVYEKEISEI